jgi:hypothetical protein
MAAQIKAMRIAIGAMPQEAQDDIATFCRTFRNMLAAGPVARIALLLVAAESSLETAKKMRDRGK